MAKKAHLSFSVDQDVKQGAEEVLKKLGITMSSAVGMYLAQVALTGSIPFEITLTPGRLKNKKNPGRLPG